MASELSRRERICREVFRRLDAMTVGQPADDPYLTSFDFLTRGSPLEQAHETEAAAATILDVDESKAIKIGQYVVTLRLNIEFIAWVNVSKREEPSTVGNRVLADVQRLMREDIMLTEPDDGRLLKDRQLAENVVEVGNQLFVDGFLDARITGAVFYVITYKHSEQDPRELVTSRV